MREPLDQNAGVGWLIFLVVLGTLALVEILLEVVLIVTS